MMSSYKLCYPVCKFSPPNCLQATNTVKIKSLGHPVTSNKIVVPPMYRKGKNCWINFCIDDTPLDFEGILKRKSSDNMAWSDIYLQFLLTLYFNYLTKTVKCFSFKYLTEKHLASLFSHFFHHLRLYTITLSSFPSFLLLFLASATSPLAAFPTTPFSSTVLTYSTNSSSLNFVISPDK